MVDEPVREPVSRRETTTREKIIVLQSSKLHGCIFPPWSSPVVASEFEGPFRDETDFKLSQAQLREFDGWQRCTEITKAVELSPSMTRRFENAKVQDLVQDVTTDCSVVASLCAITSRTERGFENLFAGMFQPWNPATAMPAMSFNGKYILRFYFNGCYRRVFIDDRLPTTKTERRLFVTNRNDPAVLWPALIEKAYLKIRGGYDFPGSNSGTDLWILSGWIPEQFFLQSDDFDRSELWRRAFRGFHFGDALITVGTGKLTEREEKGLGLVGEHDYTVIDLKEHEGQEFLLIKNPWTQGTSWKGNSYFAEEVAQELQQIAITTGSSTNGPPQKPGTPGTFWMSLDHMLQNFESIYINWNPSLFRHRVDMHLQWDITSCERPTGCFRTNPQYSVSSADGGLVWLLLSRHFRNLSQGSEDRDRVTSETNDVQGFISLYAFKERSYRVFTSETASETSDYVDSPNTLLRLDMAPGSRYIIVLSEQTLPRAQHAFTLSCLSLLPVNIRLAEDPYLEKYKHHGRWTTSTAGGNASNPLYSMNPQYSLKLLKACDVLLLLESQTDSYLVHVALVLGNGKIVRTVTSRDIVGDSGEYKKGFAVAEMRDLSADSYTIICSTFERGQIGEFDLHISATSMCLVGRIPVLGAGRFVANPGPAVFFPAIDRLLLPMMTHRINRVSVTASATGGEPQSPLRVSVASGRGPMVRSMAVSSDGDFMDSSLAAAYVHDVTISPNDCKSYGVSIVIERLSASGLGVDELVDVMVHSEESLQFGRWIDEEIKFPL